MNKLKIDVTDMYNDALIFISWYTAWNLFDVIFGITEFNKNTVPFIIIFIMSIFALLYRSMYL